MLCVRGPMNLRIKREAAVLRDFNERCHWKRPVMAAGTHFLTKCNHV